MRDFICTGKGKVYEVSANSNAAAKLEAGKRYIEETGSPYPIDFWGQYFQARVKEALPRGKTSQKVLPEIKEEA